MNTQLQSGIHNPERDLSHSENTRQLEIQLCQRLIPPTNNHELLLGFQFGDSPSGEDHPALIGIKLQPLECDTVIEAWWYKGEVKLNRNNSVRIAECQDYTVAIVQEESTTSKKFRAQTHKAYLNLLNAIRQTKHTKLVKVWNYFGVGAPQC